MTGRNRVSARDVARLAGVDPSTVSRVLRDKTTKHKYAPETIERVRCAAAELNYRPSLAARALRTGQSMMVGMVVSDVANPFFAQLASYVERSAWSEKYRVLICSTNEDAARQEQQIADLASRGVDGLIVAPVSGARLGDFGTVVAVDRPSDEKCIPYVGLDNQMAGSMLGGNLISRGYRRIGVVIPASETDPTLRSRLDGMIEGLGQSGQIDWCLEVGGDSGQLSEISRQTVDKINECRLPDAIVGLTNWCTLGVLEALRHLNITWGEEVGLAGIDDFPAAAILKPSISVVAQPIQQIAATAVGLLLEQMAKSTSTELSSINLLEPTWIERESLGDLGKRGSLRG
jgi:LacI family transcriptional regulator, galactose operon repressor